MPVSSSQTPKLSPAELTGRMKHTAVELGFGLVGVCPAVEPTGITPFREWLERGFAGEMGYLSERAGAYEHPCHVLDGVRSLVMLALDYRTAEPRAAGAGEGRISRYAWGEGDYHDLLHDKLKRLAAEMRASEPGALVRGVVDTAPLLERDFARLAGLGWIGKNTMLINRQRGSWFFLAALLTSSELVYDAPHATDHCGTCTACLDACPTAAFPTPYVLDATRCISYLTIELRTAIPTELREGMGDWLFGCDVCQEVCPWNSKSVASDEPMLSPQAANNPIDLIELFAFDDAAFRQRFRHTPLWRSKRRGILRNAAIVLGNQRVEKATPALVRGLNDEEPLIRGACAWALGRFDTQPAREALSTRRETENDATVLEEITHALATIKLTVPS